MSLRPPPDLRKKSYKTGAVDHADERKRREDALVQIRKEKREGSLAKKRRELSTTLPDVEPLPAVSHPGDECKLEILPVLVEGVCSDDPTMQLEATTSLRKILSLDQIAPIDEVINAGIVPHIVEFLSREDLPQLQYEAAWVITNISYGKSEYVQIVIQNGAILKLMQLLNSENADVREQAVWALGNIVGDSPQFRDLVLMHGGLLPVISQITENSRLSMIRNATWVLSNFFRGKPPALLEHTMQALPILRQLTFSKDIDVLTDTCWALCHFCDGASDKVDAVINAGIGQRLVEILSHFPSPTVILPVLRAVGNIATGDDSHTQFLIDNGLLPSLLQLIIEDHTATIKKEVCWIISNITAGNRDHIQAVINANVIHWLVQLVKIAESDVKTEAAWAISNAASYGSNEQIRTLVSLSCIEPLCCLLESPVTRTVMVCLQALENILKVGEVDKDLCKNDGVNVYALHIESCGGLEKIEALEEHGNNDIYKKTITILEKYWADQ